MLLFFQLIKYVNQWLRVGHFTLSDYYNICVTTKKQQWQKKQEMTNTNTSESQRSIDESIER